MAAQMQRQPTAAAAGGGGGAGVSAGPQQGAVAGQQQQQQQGAAEQGSKVGLPFAIMNFMQAGRQDFFEAFAHFLHVRVDSGGGDGAQAGHKQQGSGGSSRAWLALAQSSLRFLVLNVENMPSIKNCRPFPLAFVPPSSGQSTLPARHRAALLRSEQSRAYPAHEHHSP